VKVVSERERLLNLHVLITSKCNLHCKGCYYLPRLRDEISAFSFRTLLLEAKRLGVQNLAIGGGEPTLHPLLHEFCRFAKELGFHVGITTNGTVLYPYWADVVHISADDMHHPDRERGLRLVQRAADYYSRVVGEVGINHVFSSMQELEWWSERLPYPFLVILKKPFKPTKTYIKELRKLKEFLESNESREFMVDSCLYELLGFGYCTQGKTSLCVYPNLMVSKCSNVPGFYASSLRQAWKVARNQEGCVLRQGEIGAPSPEQS